MNRPPENAISDYRRALFAAGHAALRAGRMFGFDDPADLLKVIETIGEALDTDWHEAREMRKLNEIVPAPSSHELILCEPTPPLVAGNLVMILVRNRRRPGAPELHAFLVLESDELAVARRVLAEMAGETIERLIEQTDDDPDEGGV